MNRFTNQKAKILFVSIFFTILIIVSVFLCYILLTKKDTSFHSLISIYPTAVTGHDPEKNNEQFLADLALVKELGFEGVRLHFADYTDYGYERVADDLNNFGLKFTIAIEYNITESNVTFNEILDYFRNVPKQLVNKPNLLWYAIEYTYDWQKPYIQIEEQKFRNQTQTMINMVHDTDPNHKIFLISDSIEAVVTPPTDFDNVDGFGIMPYSKQGLIDQLDIERMKWIGRYFVIGKEVYIAEWGVQTLENSPNAKYQYGLASNESMKVKMIQEFCDYFDDLDIYLTYFGLHDYDFENSDWGIVYNDNSLKPSGEIFKKILTN